MAVEVAKDYSINNLYEIADIDNHVTFLKRLIKRYTWTVSVNENLQIDLNFIDQKKRDKNLNLSIIGEFSCGKSTFINALLRENLLVTDIIQGTTVASTVIRYSPNYGVVTEFKDGSQEVIHLNEKPELDLNDIKQYIEEITTEGKRTRQIKEVIIECPSAALKEGISIIDTPGTNSIERWHEDITKEAIRNISDVSIILTNAEQPLPDTLNKFVKDNLGDVLSRCVFVVTKMDMLQPKEQERQLEYIQKKIMNTFNIEKPVIYPYSSMTVLADIDISIKQQLNFEEENFTEILKQSYETERNIYKKLMEQRVLIQVQRLLGVMDQTFSYLSENMKSTFNEYQKSKEILEKAKKRSLKEFTDEKKAKHKKDYLLNSNNSKQGIVNQLYQSISDYKKSVMKRFDECDTKTKLTDFIESTLPEVLQKAGEQLSEEARSLYHCFNIYEKEQISIFLADFQQMYQELRALRQTEINYDFSDNDGSSVDVKNYQTSLSYLVSNSNKKEDNIETGGMIGGAVLGQIMIPIPVLGAIIGGFVGAFLGAIFAPPFSELKAECRKKVDTSIDDYFEHVIPVIEQDISEYIKQVGIHMLSQIGSHQNTYGKLVDEMIIKNEQQKQKILADITNIKIDISEIENRKCKISGIRQKIDLL